MNLVEPAAAGALQANLDFAGCTAFVLDKDLVHALGIEALTELADEAPEATAEVLAFETPGGAAVAEAVAVDAPETVEDVIVAEPEYVDVAASYPRSGGSAAG